MAKIIEANNIDSLWYRTMKTLLMEGEKMSGIQEIPNLILVLRENFRSSSFFDKEFRRIFGDERIDFASSVTFVPPQEGMVSPTYVQNDPKAKWTKTYWGRMINFGGSINQIEEAIKKLSKGKNTKMISIGIYDPTSDHRKVMGGVPCMTALDVKPRNGKVDLSVFMRSMRFSKSGYGDVHALCELGKYLCERSNMEMGSLTMFATSGHTFYSGEEFNNCKALMTSMEDRKKQKKK